MKYLAAFSLMTIFLGIAHAAPIDVPSDAWYATTVSAFGRAGYFDETQPFRPTDKTTRAEFVQLVVKLQGGVKHAPFTTQSFDDVNPNNPFFNYFEEAGLAGWLKGTGSCYGNHPCSANPDSPINRAEAATLMIRAFNLQMSEKAPTFSDNPSGLWFTLPINSAASLCVLQGDKGGTKVRPADNMIRAEMVTMLERALQNLNYPNCNPLVNFSLPKFNVQQNASSSTSSPVPSSSSSSVSTASSVSSNSFSFITSRSEITTENLQRNMDAWIEDRKSLTAKMENMSHQPKGSGCMGTLSDIDGDWVASYNNYVSIYNNLKSGGDWLPAIQTIELKMFDVKERIRVAPTYCY